MYHTIFVAQFIFIEFIVKKFAFIELTFLKDYNKMFVN